MRSLDISRAGFIADAIGRKPYMLLMFLGSIASGLLMYLAPQRLLIALCCVFVLGVFTLGVFSWMPIYLPELFPNAHSFDGIRRRLQSCTVGLLSLPILTAFLFSTLGGYQATVLSLASLYVLAIAALLLLPETRGKALPPNITC